MLAGGEAVVSYRSTYTVNDNQRISEGSAVGLNLNLFTGAYFQPSNRLLLRLNIGAASLASVSRDHQNFTQADAQFNVWRYAVRPTYSIANSSLSLFYRL